MVSVDFKVVQSRLTTLIWRCLDADLLKSAQFYAERLFALDGKNHDSRHLLATVTIRLNQYHSALQLVTRPADDLCIECLILASKCCDALGRYRRARELIDQAITFKSSFDEFITLSDNSIREAQSRSSEEAVMHCRAGTFASKASQNHQATESFIEALKLDPLLWEAWYGICSLGVSEDMENILRIPSNLQDIPSQFSPLPKLASNPAATLANPVLAKVSQQFSIAPTPAPRSTGLAFFTPEAAGPSTSTPPKYQAPGTSHFNLDNRQHEENITPPDQSAWQEESVGPRRNKKATNNTRRDPPSLEDIGPATKRPRFADRIKEESKTRNNPASTSTAARRSTRLLMGNGKQTQTKHPHTRKTASNRRRSQSFSDAEETGSYVAGPSPSSESLHSPRSDSAPPEAKANGKILGSTREPLHEGIEEQYQQLVADRYIFDIMLLFARAQHHLSRYECNMAIQTLESLPAQHQLSPTVMIMVARAHYELGNYISAESAFKAARSLDPYRVRDMELYSTLLWHLRKTAQLSFLAQELLAIDAKSAEAWIAVGNCFSLQKEHPQALVCFSRAAQMDPSCAYAYTLSGHENLDNDDVRKAMALFQTALGCDSRHYNAWYGLGSCYLKMNRLSIAQYHFERGVEIHPSNAVLLGCLGMVHEKQGRIEEALSLFNVALTANPNNPMVRYRRAKIYVKTRNFQAAEEDLFKLKDLSPTEPNVLLLLGQMYRMMGKNALATRMLTITRDLDPKYAGRIARIVEGTGKAIPPSGKGNVSMSIEVSSVEDHDTSMES